MENGSAKTEDIIEKSRFRMHFLEVAYLHDPEAKAQGKSKRCSSRTADIGPIVSIPPVPSQKPLGTGGTDPDASRAGIPP